MIIGNWNSCSCCVLSKHVQCAVCMQFHLCICTIDASLLQVIARHISEELPFMATENIIMEMVKQGADRQVRIVRVLTRIMVYSSSVTRTQ